MHPSYFKPKIIVGFSCYLLCFPLLSEGMQSPNTPAAHNCANAALEDRSLFHPLGFTGLLQATDSPVGSQTLREMYDLNQVTFQSARTISHTWQCYTMTSLLL